jgi:hypothetical protein
MLDVVLEALTHKKIEVSAYTCHIHNSNKVTSTKLILYFPRFEIILTPLDPTSPISTLWHETSNTSSSSSRLNARAGTKASRHWLVLSVA